MLSSALGKCPFPATVGAEGNGGGRGRKLFHPAAPSPVPLPCSIHDFCTWDVQQILISAAQSPLSSPAWSCLLLSCVLVCLLLIFINVFNAYKKDFSASLGWEIHTCTVNHCFGSFCQTPGGGRGVRWDFLSFGSWRNPAGLLQGSILQLIVSFCPNVPLKNSGNHNYLMETALTAH